MNDARWKERRWRSARLKPAGKHWRGCTSSPPGHRIVPGGSAAVRTGSGVLFQTAGEPVPRQPSHHEAASLPHRRARGDVPAATRPAP